MKQYIILLVDKTKIGEEIGCLSRGKVALFGFTPDHKDVKKLDIREQAERLIKRIQSNPASYNRLAQRYNLFASEVTTNGQKEKDRRRQTHYRQLSFPNLG